jgi:hypothetical protein
LKIYRKNLVHILGPEGGEPQEVFFWNQRVWIYLKVKRTSLRSCTSWKCQLHYISLTIKIHRSKMRDIYW